MKLREIIGRLYAVLLARPGRLAQAINHALFHLALRGMGYNNGWQLDRSGELWFIKNVIAKRDQPYVVDVGANRGEYSLAVLENTNGSVLALEPLGICEAPLARLWDRYEGRFSHLMVAAGAVESWQKIHYSETDSEWASLVDVDQLPGYAAQVATLEHTVRVHTLDGILLDYEPEDDPGIDLLKIDVEGLELEVLQGAQKLISDRPPAWVQIEWNLHQLLRGHTLRSVAALLPSYVCYQLLPHGLRRVDVDRPEANVFCYGNFVFQYVGERA
jgi:FkbM family methyltransferase